MNSRSSPNHLYVLLYWLMAAGLTCWFGWTFISHPVFTFSLNNDFWEHSAAVREWMNDLWHPRNPHLATETGSPRYMPFFFVLAVTGKLIGLGAIDTLKIGAIFNIAFLTLGIFLFFRAYFRNDLAPIIGLIVLLTGWGLAWTWSNVYQLRGLLYVAPYPSSFSFAATLVCLWLQTAILGSERHSLVKHGGLACLIGLTFATHPLTGAFALGALGLLAICHPGVRTGVRVTSIMALGIGLLLAELWPYYSVLKVTMGVSGGEANSWVSGGDFAWDARPRELLNHPFYAPPTVLSALGPTLAGIACLIFLVRRGEHKFILFGALSMLAPYFINLIYPIPLGHRFLLFAIFFMHLAMVWAVMETIHRLSPTNPMGKGVSVSAASKFAGACVAIVLLVGLAYNLNLAQIDYRRHYADEFSVPATIGQVLHSVPNDSVILAKPMLAWPVPTFAGKIVSLFHPNPMVLDQVQRNADVARFFDPATSAAERTRILRQYDVSHVLIRLTDTDTHIVRYLDSLGSGKETHGDLQLVTLRSSKF